MNHTSNSLLKIAVVGPESTGKSTMAKYLAEKLNTFCVPEYARYYCQGLNNQYTMEDEMNMYYGQLALEEAIADQVKNNILVCDTTILTVKIWCDYLFQKTPPIVTNEIARRKYDLYLLMDIDLAWEDDPLRDFPNERTYFMDVWKNELINLNANVFLVSGTGNTRLENGLKAFQQYYKDKIKT